MKKIRCCRTNISPKSFFTYCKKQCIKKGINLEDWVTYDNFADPLATGVWHICKHEELNESKRKLYKRFPFKYQCFLEDSYNFIIEFQFYDNKKCRGYLYLEEY